MAVPCCAWRWFVDALIHGRFRRENDDESVTISDLKGTVHYTVHKFQTKSNLFRKQLAKDFSLCPCGSRPETCSLFGSIWVDHFLQFGCTWHALSKVLLIFSKNIEYVVGQAWCISILGNLLPHFWLVKKIKNILGKLGKLGRPWTIWQQKSHRQLGLVCPLLIKHCNGKLPVWRWFSHLNVHSYGISHYFVWFPEGTQCTLAVLWQAFHFFSASINLKPDFPSSYMLGSQ